MELALLVLVALLLVAAAVYTQSRIALFTKGIGRVVATRIFLLLAGVGFGWVMSRGVSGDWERGLLFLAGFGLVHLPGAAILFIKGRRGSGRS